MFLPRVSHSDITLYEETEYLDSGIRYFSRILFPRILSEGHHCLLRRRQGNVVFSRDVLCSTETYT